MQPLQQRNALATIQIHTANKRRTNTKKKEKTATVINFLWQQCLCVVHDSSAYALVNTQIYDLTNNYCDNNTYYNLVVHLRQLHRPNEDFL
jgi:hypothetical protein